MNPKKKDHGEQNADDKPLGTDDDTSMTTLILWNISKALQRNPHLDLKLAIKNVHERLGNTRDVNKIMTHSPEERHLACALLAWHELGNTTAESLYDFIEDKFGDQERDKGGQTDDLEAKQDSADKPKHSRTVGLPKLEQQSSEYLHRPIRTHNSMHAQTSNVEQQRSEYKQHPIRDTYTKAKHEDKPERTTVKIVNVEQQRSGSLHHPTSDHIDNKNCKSCSAKENKTEETQDKYGKFCCNIYREETERFCTGSDPKCLKNTKKKEALKNLASTKDATKLNSQEDFDTCSLRGPVVSLPPDTKIVMRCDQNPPSGGRRQGKKSKEQEKDIMCKIDAACCMDSACAERLAQLDKATTELRSRAAKLARREAERVELLERAEAAWRDLELGYQRRLNLAEEKEYDMVKQVKKLLEERNGYKSACLNLAKLLKERGDMTEKSRDELVQLEKEMCGLACTRMRLSGEAARSDAAVTEQHIKVSQMDRDFQFKEDEKRRKLLTAQSEVESVRALTVEAERAMRAELNALREQVDNVSNQLLREDDENIQIKIELDSLRDEKSGLGQDLEGCQLACDKRMQKKMDELKKQRDFLKELKDKVIECQCKVPMDAAVEVKRTPSLAALCACSPEDRLLESCSCTSLRSQLLSNLLADLFGGLQTELGDVGVQMPCQLLKCLEDKHNWDKSSVVKTNLRNFFSQLLIGELDIAIATSIEKYHARWIGASCADTLRMIPEPNQKINDSWQQVQERAIERKAQKLANKLAEQLFQERADQLVQRAREAVKADPPPCECKETAVFPCLVKPPVVGGEGFADNNRVIPTYWRRTFKDVTQLRVQIEDLKKESLKKEDLKRMEEKIFKLVQRPMEPEPPITGRGNNPKELNTVESNNKKDIKSQHRSVNTEQSFKVPPQLSRPIRKKQVDLNGFSRKSPKKVLSEKQERLNKNIKKVGVIHEFAVNTCFCGNQSGMPKLISDDKSHKLNAESEDKSLRKQTFPKNSTDQVSGPKHTKPISGNLESTLSDIKNTKTPQSVTQSSCQDGCICFHRIPSNTSIDKLLEKLTKWKSDLNETSQEAIKSNISTNVDVLNEQAKNDTKNSENSTQSDITYQASGIEIPNNKANHNKSTDNSTNLEPNTTNSEYMGAVNLDKSSDHCHCILKLQNNKKLKRNKNEANSNGSPFKCINSELCECKKSLESKNNSSNIYNKSSRQETIKKNTRDNDLVLESQSKKRNLKLPNIHQTIRNVLSVNEPSKKAEDENHVINEIETDVKHNKTSDLPCDCDYYVKLLGVTLANISSHKFDEKLAISDRKHKTETTLHSNDQEPTKQSNKAKSDENSLNVQCQCHVKFDEFKNYMENNFRKQLGPKDDKELDVQSFGEKKSNNEESCVCCINCPINDSEELEVNTFYLLEEHLRGKLEKLKKSCCQFSTLPAAEEEKLFSAILERVRQIISSSTNEITCKCMYKDGNQTDGSWNRANTLLQEYLKTKIQKVQCYCANDDQKQECVLPKVLDEIYCLIEKDFQRLRNVYNSQSINNIIKENLEEIPEKDTNKSKDHQEKPNAPKNAILIDKDIDKLSKLNSNKSMIITQSMSAQVPHNLGMVTKSIDVMEKGTKNMQTSESMKSVAKKSFNSVETENCDCETKINNSTYVTQEVLVNHHMTSNNNNEISNYSKETNSEDMKLANNNKISNYSKETNLEDKKIVNNNKISNNSKETNLGDMKLSAIDKSNEQASPYIGYTIDCACKCALGMCTCTKSSVVENNKKINNIWNDLTNDNIQSQNISYIMDSISEKHKNKPYNFTEQTLKATNSNQTSMKNDSDLSDDDIILKESKRNVIVSNNSANTSCNKFADEFSARSIERYYVCDGCRKPVLKNSVRSESHLPNSTFMHKTQSLDCDCTMVPVCHVKMLVDNIENRLYHSKCTCDSFNPRVCPIHSKSFN